MPSSEPASRASARARWWTWFAAALVALFAWTGATPLFAAPDEQAHAVRSAVMIRGDLEGKDLQTAFGLVARVSAPSWLEDRNPSCFLQQLEVTPACVTPFDTRDGEHAFNIVMGAYSPWYFLAIGVPTVPWSGDPVLYLMRVMTAMVCAALFASAFASAQRIGRWAVAGVFASMTPMAFYIGGVLNPNGIEIAAAIAVWSSAAALARAHDVDERLVARTAIAFAICANTRALSLPMVAFALVAPLLLANRERWRLLARVRRVRTWVAVAAVGVLAQLAWSAFSGFKKDLLPRVDFTFMDALRDTWNVFVEAVAVFGWTEVRPPGVAVLWLVVFVLLVGLALTRADRREVAVLVGVIAVAILFPVLVRILQLPRLHAVWLGRYGIPLTAGVPILAGVLISTGARRGLRVPVVTLPALVTVLAAGQVVAFAAAARRYAGSSSRFFYLVDPVWTPPIPPAVLLLAFAAAIGALAWMVAAATVPTVARGDDRWPVGVT